jgi:serine/threonine protein kinase
MRVRLLRCLGKALVKHGARFVLNLAPGGDVLYDIAAETWEAYLKDGGAAEAAAELESLAQAATDQMQTAVKDVVRQVASDCSEAVQEAIAAYLTQVPAAIRRSLRRPSEPSGRTVPPGHPLTRAEDLAQLLPPRAPRFKPGDRPLPGVDWQLEELAGVGGFGEVWKARHPYLKSKPPVALKFCLDPSATAALRNEAGVLDRVMQQGRHCGIVPLLHTYLSADPPCLEYEFVEGADLASLIQEMHARGKVKPEVANRLLVRLAEIVAFAHKGEPPIVHGDLKPANVLVRRTADGKLALRVIDFGIGGLAAARAAQEVRQPTRSRSQLLTEAVRGAHTPLYASPEQMARRPGAAADPRDDVHALGVIWYQLLTGDLGMTSIPPDWREQLAEHGVGEALIKLLGACVAPKADKRPASAAVLVEQIQAAHVPMAEPADADAVVHVKAHRPRSAAPPTGSAAKPPAASTPKGRPTIRPQGPMPTAMPAAGKSSKNRMLLAVAGGAVLLFGVIGLCAGGLLLMNRQPEKQVGKPPSKSTEDKPDGADPKDNDVSRKENFDKLKVGMTEKQLEDILGKGELASAHEVEAEVDEKSRKLAWSKAASENRVRAWKAWNLITILAAFGADGKVVALYRSYHDSALRTADEIGSLLKVTEENFGKLKLGMTEKQVEDILGKGKVASATDVEAVVGEGVKKAVWSKAGNDSKVRIWRDGTLGTILATFTAGKAIAFYYANPNHQAEIGSLLTITEDSFAKLTLGMTLTQLQDALGAGRRATTDDVDKTLRISTPPPNATEWNQSRRAAWNKAVEEQRVHVWQEGESRILAAFPGIPSAGTKVDLLLLKHGIYPVQNPHDKWLVSKESFAKLKLGMTLKEMDDILGLGWQKKPEDLASVWVRFLSLDEIGVTRKAAWSNAAKQEKVRFWQDGWNQILAAFSDDPATGGKVEVLMSSTYIDLQGFQFAQKPADMWAATKDNFDKLKVGMTLKEVNAILGSGPRITREQMGNVYWGGAKGKKLEADEEARKGAWEKAVKEQRVHRWEVSRSAYHDADILVAFPETPSDNTKAEAFYYWKSGLVGEYAHISLPN